MGALNFPLNMDALKRNIENTEKVSLSAVYDNQAIDAALTLFSNSLQHIQSVHNAGIEERKEEYNGLVDMLSSVGNTLFSKIETLEIATPEDLETISNNLGSLKALIEGDGAITVLKTIDAVADALNDSMRSLSFPISVNDATGTAELNITALGFANTADYSATISLDATSAFVFAHFATKKADATKLEVVAYDSKWTPEQRKPYDGSTTPARFTVVIHYFAPKLNIDVTDTSGETQVVGGN